VRAKVVAADQLDAALLARDIPGPNSAPRVVILVNVPRLTPEAQRALEGFLSAGGGVLATMGDRCDGAFYTDQLYREGTGWLPARPIEPVGDESAPERAARIVPASLFHPAVELFREPVPGGLGDGRLPRYWKLSARDSALSTAIAMLTTGDPFLVERPTGKGRALVCCVPLDNSWRTNLPDLPAFAPLAHELVSYLAGARSADSNLQPGQPIVFRPSDDEPPGPVRLQPPDGPPVTLPVASWPLTYDEAREPGVYTLTTASGRTAWFVVQTDAREADLAAATDADRERVAGLLPKRPDGSPMLRYVETGGGDAAAEPPQNLELGWLAFLAVVLLLLGEVALTRRLAMAR
jgi:hypothetical protein